MPRKRTDDLLVDAYGWLEADDAVQSRLGDAGEVVTYGQVRAADDDELAPVTVAVTVIPGNSDRNNKQEDKTVVLEVEVSASNAWIASRGGTLELTRLAGDVADAVAVHRDGWGFEGKSGGSGAVSSDPDRPRYSAVRRFDFSRHDPAVAYD